MEIITKEYEVYTFTELDKEVQEKLIENEKEYYYENVILYDLNEIMEEQAIYLLETNFKNASFINVYYSLGHSQGDGAMIEFNINIKDINNKYNMLAKKDVDKIIEVGCDDITINQSGHYYHEHSFDIDYSDITYYIENFENVELTLNKMISLLQWDIVAVNKELASFGYAYLEQEIEDEIIIDNLEMHKYLKDGTIFNIN